MLTEMKNVEQIPGEPRRRWFSDRYFDLIVWVDDRDRILGFQLCYDKLRNERFLTWWPDRGYRHGRIDDGEDRPGKQKATPILVADGEFERDRIADLFKTESAGLEEDISSLVYDKIKSWPAG